MSLVGTRPILQDELQKYELHHRASLNIYVSLPPLAYRNLFIINTFIYDFLLYSFIVSLTTSSQLYFLQTKSAACCFSFITFSG